MIDCADHDRIKLARDEFTKLVNDREMKDACVLIYANKQGMVILLILQKIEDLCHFYSSFARALRKLISYSHSLDSILLLIDIKYDLD